MAKLFNPTNASRMFGDAFTSSFSQTQGLIQQESQFNREMNFQERQLKLIEGFRRDELAQTAEHQAMIGDYYQDQIRLKEEEGRVGLIEKGYTEYDETMSPSPTPVKLTQAFGGSWVNPSAPPQEIARWVDAPFGTKAEVKGYWKDGEWVSTNFEQILYPPEPTSGGGGDQQGKRIDVSNEVGEVNKLLEIYKGFKKENDTIEVNLPNGDVAEWDKTLWRANAKRYTADILSKVGIDPQGDYIDGIRTNAKVPVYGKNQWESFSGEQKNFIAKNRENALLQEIYNRRYKGEINDQEYEALRYWALVGSR